MVDLSQFAVVSTSGAARSGVDLRSLPDGTNVVVETCNSRYRVVMREGDGFNAVVQGGRYFRQATEARIEGSTLGGALLKIGWIGIGLFLELSVRGKRILTSRVRSIRIDTGGAGEGSPAANENPLPGLAYSEVRSTSGDRAAAISR
jgi:hypothetical protein